MKECRFKENGSCKVLTGNNNCVICKFYQTMEQKYLKEDKIRKWYKKRGINYDVFVEGRYR